MPYTLPPPVEAFLAKRPTIWALVTELLDRLSSLEGLSVDAGMAGVSIGETSYPLLNCEFREARVLAFRISITDEIGIRFMTVADRMRFESLCGKREPPPGTAKHGAERSADLERGKEAMLKCDCADTQALADALIVITSTTPMRRLIANPTDQYITALLKQLYAARDAYHYEVVSEEIAKALTDKNLDQTMDLVVKISPWADEDARNVADTKFVLLYEAIYEHKKHLSSAVQHLLSLRSEFEKFGGDALENVQEIDDLLKFLKGTTH
ncbi:MAG: hypothetical protein ABJH52_07250 [Henriciella sp.]